MSKIWNPVQLLAALFPQGQRAAATVAMRWKKAFRTNPELVCDLIKLGRVMSVQPARYEGGIEMPDAIDPMRMAYEAGQRDMALKLLALGGQTEFDLRTLMEDPDVH